MNAEKIFYRFEDYKKENNIKYRKKPVVVEAIQFNSVLDISILADFVTDGITIKKAEPIELIIKTLEGDMVASIGDYIIKGVNGEFYPYKPDIFEKTYEKVEE